MAILGVLVSKRCQKRPFYECNRLKLAKIGKGGKGIRSERLKKRYATIKIFFVNFFGGCKLLIIYPVFFCSLEKIGQNVGM